MQNTTHLSAPQELISNHQWIVWRSELDDKGEPTKVPYRSDFRSKASSINPADRSTFADARIACERFPEFGLGFVLADSDPFVCIDVDVKEGQTLTDKQREILDRFASTYIEASPSGRGYHIWVRAALPQGHPTVLNEAGEKVCEVYSRARYMTVTGAQCIVGDRNIEERQADVEALLAAFPHDAPLFPTVPDQMEVLTDGEILTKCAQAANGDKFKELWEGRWEQLGYPSNSEADLALCNLLAFWTDNRNQARRLFLQSELGKRPKAKQNATRNVATAFDQKVPPIDPLLATKFTEDLKAQLAITKREVETEYKDWTVPPGMVGQIATFIYDQAPSPLKEVALAGAIAYYAGLMGRGYSVSGMALNQYIVVLAKSGQGKEAAKRGTGKLTKLLDEMVGEHIDMFDRIGPEQINSAQGLLNRLSRTPCMMSILGEFGKLLEAITHKNASQNDVLKLSALLKLFNTDFIGTNAYADSEKNGKSIDRPAFTILGESTPSTFYKAVDESSMKDGFLPRLTIIEYSGDSPEPNENHEFVQPNPNTMLTLQSQIRLTVNAEMSRNVTAVKFSPEADVFQKDLRAKCRKHVDECNRNNEEHITEIWTRVHAKTIKIAALIAVGVNSVEPVISLADIQWAEDLVMRGTHKLIARFKAGDVGQSNWQFDQTRRLEQQLRTYISSPWKESYRLPEQAKLCGIVSYQYLNTYLSPLKEFKSCPWPNGLNNTIKIAIDTGKLVEVKDQMVLANRKGRFFQIVA